MSVDGLLPDDEVRFIRNGLLSSSRSASAASYLATENVSLDGDVFVRAEVWRNGRAVVLSNSLSFVRSVVPAGLSAFRASIDLQGIVSTDMTGLSLQTAAASVTGSRSTLSLDVDADGGMIVLDYAQHGAPTRVTFDTVSGSWSLQGRPLTLSGLTGAGTINIVAAGEPDSGGVADIADNCTSDAKPRQQDTDADNIGNACGPNIAQPNNCAVDFADLNAVHNSFFSQPGSVGWNPDADFNSDDAVNFADLEIMKSRFFGAPGPSGLPNACSGPAGNTSPR